MSPKIQKIALFAIFYSIVLALPLAVLAQGFVPQDLIDRGDIVGIIRNIIRFILIVAFVLAFVFLLIGGIRWIVAGGDEKGVAAARGMITAALIGLVIVLVSFAIIRLVEVFFDLKLLTETTDVESIPRFDQ